MKFLAFAQIDSTSSHAQRLLDEGVAAPFAVWACQQTAGRGRMGRSWMSPQGGLYLTIVLGPEALSHEAKTQLPISVAAAVATWIQKVFGVRTTIKWPNDLLYGTAKLVGILCEGRVQGTQWGPSLIGIGINVKGQAPIVPEQLTISLEEILGTEIVEDIEALAQSLSEHVRVCLASEHPTLAYSDFAIENGQLWKDTDGRLACITGLTASGNLRLREWGSGADTEIQSIHHNWSWVYQVEDPRPLLVVDIGNSRCKLAVFLKPLDSSAEPDVLSLDLKLPEAQLEQMLREFLQPLHLAPGWVVHSISVRDQAAQLLAKLLRPFQLGLSGTPKRPLRVDFSTYRLEQMGSDRVALVEGARQAFPGRNLIVVSAGTALTVEVLSAEAKYLGGYILAGLHTRLEALAEKTEKLPDLRSMNETSMQALFTEALLGSDTVSAMIRGALNELKWSLLGLRKALIESGLSDDWQFCVTGGNAEIIGKLLDAPCRPSLILNGVRLFVLGGLKTGNSKFGES